LEALFEIYLRSHTSFGMAMVSTAPVYDTSVMLYGFHHYTAVWAGRVRSSNDLANWVHVPAKNVINLLDTLSQFPKLQVLVIDVFNDLLKDGDPLALSTFLSETVTGFYAQLEKAIEGLPRLKVSYLNRFFNVVFFCICIYCVTYNSTIVSLIYHEPIPASKLHEAVLNILINLSGSNSMAVVEFKFD